MPYLVNQRIPKRAANAETILTLVNASNLTMIDGLNITAKEGVKWHLTDGTEAECRSTSPYNVSHPDIVWSGITPPVYITETIT